MRLTILRIGLGSLALALVLQTSPAADGPSLQWKRAIGFCRVVTAGHLGKTHKLTVLAATDDGALYAMNPGDGATLWRFSAGDQNMGCPAIADVDNDGANEALVGAADNTLYVLSGDDGRVKWKFKTGGFITAAPVVARLSRGNRLPEVVLVTHNGTVHCMRGDGKQSQWERKFGRPLLATPAIADLNGDQQLDVVVMTDEGSVTVLEGFSGNEIAVYSVTNARTAAPVLIDLNRDLKAEVIHAGQRLEARGNARSGWGSFWSYGGSAADFAGTPAVGDLEGDGTPEVVALARDGVVHCLNALTGRAQWTARVSKDTASASCSPVIADLGGERKASVLISTPEGNLVALNESGKQQWSMNLEGYADMSPVVFSLDGGKSLTVIASEAATRTVRALALGSGGQVFWGKIHGDAANTGYFPNALAYGNVLRGDTK